MKLDIVDLDDGYYAYYVDGILLRESGEHDIREIIDIVNGKFVKSMTYRCLAIGDDWNGAPKRYDDIEWGPRD